MEPTIGRIVHYFSTQYSIDKETVEIIPAIITKVHNSGLVNLRLLGSDLDYKTSVRFGDGEPGTWVWPPRV